MKSPSKKSVGWSVHLERSRDSSFGPLSFSQQVARTERTPSLNRNGFIRIEGGAVGGYGESRGCFVAETSFYDYHRGRWGRKSSSYIPVSFRLEEVDSFSTLPGQTRRKEGDRWGQRWGYTCYTFWIYNRYSVKY